MQGMGSTQPETLTVTPICRTVEELQCCCKLHRTQVAVSSYLLTPSCKTPVHPFAEQCHGNKTNQQQLFHLVLWRATLHAWWDFHTNIM